MKKQFRIAAILAACAVLSSCGTYRDGSYPDAPGAAQQADSTAESAERIVNETTVPAETTTEALPEKTGPGDNFIWNPERNEYYNSDLLRWDEERKDYVHVEQTGPSENQLKYERMIEETPDFEGEIPAELRTAIEAYNAAWETEASKPENSARSDNMTELAPDEYNAMVQAGIRNFDTIAALSVSKHPEATRAQFVVLSVLKADVLLDVGGLFRMNMQCAYAAATEAVQAEGDALTAESVSRLQAQYGFMIAPALRDLGKLNLMQIPADAPCTDAEQLAAFADYFK